METMCRSYRYVVKDLFAAHSYINEMGDRKRDMLELIEGLIVKYKRAADESIGYVQDPSDIFNQ